MKMFICVHFKSVNVYLSWWAWCVDLGVNMLLKVFKKKKKDKQQKNFEESNRPELASTLASGDTQCCDGEYIKTSNGNRISTMIQLYTTIAVLPLYSKFSTLLL